MAVSVGGRAVLVGVTALGVGGTGVNVGGEAVLVGLGNAVCAAAQPFKKMTIMQNKVIFYWGLVNIFGFSLAN